MAIDYGWQNRTVIGVHSKDEDTFAIIKGDLPILTKESEALFLLTRDQFFTISTPQISNVLANYKRYKSVHNTVRLIANILLIPGLFIALAYLLRQLGILDSIPFVKEFVSSKIADILFSLSILNVLILWHDYYKDKSNPIRLPKTEIIPSKDLEDISINGFKFGRYAHLEAIRFVNDSTIDLICSFTKNNLFNISSIFAYLIQTDECKEIFKRANISITQSTFVENDITKETIPDYNYTAIRSFLIYALNEALLTASSEVEPKHLLLAMFTIFPVLKKVLLSQNCSVDILREVSRYQSYALEKRKKANYLNPNVPYFRKGGIAKSWIYGYTFVLSKFSQNLNEYIAEDRDIYGIGHESEIDTLISVLGKTSNKNALFVGEVGVGKSSIVLGIAQKINSGDVPLQLKDKRIIQLDINGLIAYSSSQKNTEMVISKAMKELENAGDVILYIDEMQELVPAKAGESGHSLAGILLPYIVNSKFPILGSVNYADYRKYFYSTESFRQSFTNIEIKEISAVDALEILETKINQLEENYQVYLTFPALIATVELAQRYNKERKLPSSAVQLVESVCSWAQSSGVKIVTEEHVSKVLSNQKGISIGSINVEESSRIMKLEENMKKKIVGQDEAIISIVEALRRAHVDIRSPNKPIAAFLFLGPTGVGKTHVAKIVAEEYFGDQKNIVRVDMSEYKELNSISKFLGEKASGDILSVPSLSLVDKIKSNPYSIVLFDEIEKAHPQILDLFLQLFDEGRLTSTIGETIDFTHSIIICTSNIGSPLLLSSLTKSEVPWEDTKNRVLIELKQTLKPELFNRFDKVIVFHPHDLQNLARISQLLLEELAKRLSEKSIILKWSEIIPQLIASKVNEPGLGARPLKRYIQDNIESNLAKEILEGHISSGGEVEIEESWIL